jgi:hypothetical protein
VPCRPTCLASGPGTACSTGSCQPGPIPYVSGRTRTGLKKRASGRVNGPVHHIHLYFQVVEGVHHEAVRVHVQIPDPLQRLPRPKKSACGLCQAAGLLLLFMQVQRPCTAYLYTRHELSDARGVSTDWSMRQTMAA